jgi:hypothetical protein
MENRSKQIDELLVGSYLAAWQQYVDMCQMEQTQMEAAEWHRKLVLMRYTFSAWLQVLPVLFSHSSFVCPRFRVSLTLRSTS